MPNTNSKFPWFFPGKIVSNRFWPWIWSFMPDLELFFSHRKQNDPPFLLVIPSSSFIRYLLLEIIISIIFRFNWGQICFTITSSMEIFTLGQSWPGFGHPGQIWNWKNPSLCHQRFEHDKTWFKFSSSDYDCSYPGNCSTGSPCSSRCC